MPPPLKVLLLEDSENDALLLELALERAGYAHACKRVDTPEDLLDELARQPWDVIIADYVMPRFSGIEALALVKQQGLDLPFIIVSGHITDDTAVAAMKAGAHDYVMKDNLARLGPAVERELREAEVRRERRRVDGRLKAEHAITRILAHETTLAAAAPGIVQALLVSLEMEIGTLWVVDSQSGHLRAELTGLRTSNSPLGGLRAANHRSSFSQGHGLPGRAWKERKPIWLGTIPGDTPDPRWDLASDRPIGSAVAFPIQNAGDFFGVLEFCSLRSLSLDASLVNTMTAVCSEIGQFTQRRRAQEALRRAHDELELRVQQRTADLQLANQELQAAISERRRLEQELLEITEKERRRIGLDLHDDLGQRLSGIALMTKGLELRLAKTNSSLAEEAGKIYLQVQQTVGHASRLARDLATLDLQDNCLTDALEALAGRASQLFHVPCRFRSRGAIPSLEPHVVGQLYKIAQEAVTNAVKHGKAKRVLIHLALHHGRVTLSVRNLGTPFPDLQSRSTGMGLRIMNYRASLIGAALEVTRVEAGGTLVRCSLPASGNPQ